MVDTLSFLEPHPVLEFPGVASAPPLVDVDDHDPRVEVARGSGSVEEGGGEGRGGPEGLGEVAGEVGVAVLWGAEHVWAQVDVVEVGHVVDYDEVGVEVDHAGDVAGEEVGEVEPGVVEGLVQGVADGGGDLAEDEEGVEVEERD